MLLNFPALISWVRRRDLPSLGLLLCTGPEGVPWGRGAQGTCAADMQGAGWPRGRRWRPQPQGKAAGQALPVTTLPAALQEASEREW